MASQGPEKTKKQYIEEEIKTSGLTFHNDLMAMREFLVAWEKVPNISKEAKALIPIALQSIRTLIKKHNDFLDKNLRHTPIKFSIDPNDPNNIHKLFADYADASANFILLQSEITEILKAEQQRLGSKFTLPAKFTQEHGKMNFESFLLKVVQRVSKYPLFCNDLIKEEKEPESKSYKEIEAFRQVALDAVGRINAAKDIPLRVNTLMDRQDQHLVGKVIVELPAEATLAQLKDYARKLAFVGVHYIVRVTVDSPEKILQQVKTAFEAGVAPLVNIKQQQIIKKWFATHPEKREALHIDTFLTPSTTWAATDLAKKMGIEVLTTRVTKIHSVSEAWPEERKESASPAASAADPIALAGLQYDKEMSALLQRLIIAPSKSFTQQSKVVQDATLNSIKQLIEKHRDFHKAFAQGGFNKVARAKFIALADETARYALLLDTIKAGIPAEMVQKPLERLQSYAKYVADLKQQGDPANKLTDLQEFSETITRGVRYLRSIQQEKNNVFLRVQEGIYTVIELPFSQINKAKNMPSTVLSVTKIADEKPEQIMEKIKASFAAGVPPELTSKQIRDVKRWVEKNPQAMMKLDGRMPIAFDRSLILAQHLGIRTEITPTARKMLTEANEKKAEKISIYPLMKRTGPFGLRRSVDTGKTMEFAIKLAALGYQVRLVQGTENLNDFDALQGKVMALTPVEKPAMGPRSDVQATKDAALSVGGKEVMEDLSKPQRNRDAGRKLPTLPIEEKNKNRPKK